QGGAAIDLGAPAGAPVLIKNSLFFANTGAPLIQLAAAWDVTLAFNTFSANNQTLVDTATGSLALRGNLFEDPAPACLGINTPVSTGGNASENSDSCGLGNNDFLGPVTLPQPALHGLCAFAVIEPSPNTRGIEAVAGSDCPDHDIC